jgi:predicted DNA repair protein MutK
MTVGVYGLVAGIVKLDDLGLYLSLRPGNTASAAAVRRLGVWILHAAPYLMRVLTVVGTAAMFLVGGGILTHGIPALHHLIEDLASRAGEWLGVVVPLLMDGVVGVLAGALTLLVVTGGQKLLRRPAAG